MMECPSCGGGCVQEAPAVLAGIERLYIACRDCRPDPELDKSGPLADLPAGIGRCPSCGRAPLDGVMLDALRILVEFGLRDEHEGLRSVGTPLPAVGYPLAYPPRIGPRGLTIVGDRLSREAAAEMVARIPEVRGVILSRGVPGIWDLEAPPGENELLAGCDIRADIIQSLFGELVVYKSQSRIHIEYPRQSAPKMRILEGLYLDGRIRDVVDGLCGPGSLGMMCVLAGAERVVLNDAWLPAVENVILNLRVNRVLLGIEDMEILARPVGPVGGEPLLVCRADGACEIEVYHGDLSRLFSRVRPADLCLIDHFPGASTRALEDACSCCRQIVIV
ncbi:MAG: methyltransferase [Methanothrix sp.]|nr:methyltransferase [Methanothrix sp.]